MMNQMIVGRRKEPVSSHENTGLASSSIGFIVIIYAWKWSHHATSTEGTIYKHERKKRMPFNKAKHSDKWQDAKRKSSTTFSVGQLWISKPLLQDQIWTEKRKKTRLDRNGSDKGNKNRSCLDKKRKRKKKQRNPYTLSNKQNIQVIKKNKK